MSTTATAAEVTPTEVTPTDAGSPTKAAALATAGTLTASPAATATADTAPSGHEASPLFRPARLGALRLKNRLVMAPMTRNRAGATGVPEPIMATYYAQRTSAGLIIAEAAATPSAVGPRTPTSPRSTTTRTWPGDGGSPRRCGRPAGRCSSSCSTAGGSGTPRRAGTTRRPRRRCSSPTRCSRPPDTRKQ